MQVAYGRFASGLQGWVSVFYIFLRSAIGMNISELKEKKINEQTQMAKKLKIERAAGFRNQELIFA